VGQVCTATNLATSDIISGLAAASFSIRKLSTAGRSHAIHSASVLTQQNHKSHQTKQEWQNRARGSAGFPDVHMLEAVEWRIAGSVPPPLGAHSWPAA
jgi:hypothetical protein